jgi:hypothetical protein
LDKCFAICSHDGRELERIHDVAFNLSTAYIGLDKIIFCHGRNCGVPLSVLYKISERIDALILSDSTDCPTFRLGEGSHEFYIRELSQEDIDALEDLRSMK